MSRAEDFEARLRAVHGVRAEVDEILGFGPAPAAPAPRAPMTLDDAALRRCLAERTPGEWRAVGAIPREEDEFILFAPARRMGSIVTGRPHALADASLACAAPALAAEVLALRAAVREYIAADEAASHAPDDFGADGALLDARAKARALVGEG
jgi:hypothetical protein